MAELCLECFIDTWHPSAYDRAHIVMSNDNEFCEGCMDCVPYVDHIDPSDMALTPTADDLKRVYLREKRAGGQIACVECGATLENDDFAFVYETGKCPYCHSAIDRVWKRPSFL